MRLDRIEIDNFRRFKRVALELPDGVIALVGRNGAGKSTVLEALGWCLYGNDAARTAKDLIKRRGCAPDERVRVQLAFRYGAHAYEVTRELVGKAETHVATILVDGKVTVPAGASSGKEATSYVERLFHMDRVAFFTSLVARQRELSALTDAKPAERKRILIGLLRLDAVDDAIRLARERKRDARAELGGLRAGMRDLPALEASLAHARAQLAAQQDALQLADASISALVDEVEDVRARRDASRKRADEHRAACLRLATIAERVGALAKQREQRATELARARAAAESASKLAEDLLALPAAKDRAEALAAIRIRHEESNRVKSELVKSEMELARARAEAEAARGLLANAATVRSLVERASAQRATLQDALGVAQRAEADALARIREAESRAREIDEKAARVRELGADSPCPTCTRPLREHYDGLLHGFSDEAAAHRAGLDAHKAALAAAREQSARLRAELLQLSGREGELQVKLQGLAREEQRLAAATRSAEESGARVERLRAQAAALLTEPYDPEAHKLALVELRRLEGLQQQHARFLAEADRAGEVARLLDEIGVGEAAARAEDAQAKAARDALGFEPAAHEALEKSAETADARLSEARVRRERLVAERARHSDEEKRVAEDIARQLDLAARAMALEARIVVLEQLASDREAGILPEFKDHLVGRVRPLLSAHAGRLFRELTEGRYADLEVNDEYDLQVHDEGAAFALERFSGGESDLANLCLRLAVSQVVAERAGTEGFGFLALDEVFGSQDEVRKANILRSLKTLSARFRQVVLITHIDDVKDAVEHVLRVTALDDGTSSVTVEGTS